MPGRSILALLSEIAAVAEASQNKSLGEATAKVIFAMQEEGLIGPKEDWVYQTIMHQMFQSGVFPADVCVDEPTTPEHHWLM